MATLKVKGSKAKSQLDVTYLQKICQAKIRLLSSKSSHSGMQHVNMFKVIRSNRSEIEMWHIINMYSEKHPKRR